jgi:hypothetical protein
VTATSKTTRVALAAAVGGVVGISVILGLEQAEAGGVGWFVLVGFVLLLFPALLAVLLSAPDFDIGRGTVYGALAAASPLAVGTAYASSQNDLAGPVGNVLFIVASGLVGGATGAMAVAVVGALRGAKTVPAGVERG